MNFMKESATHTSAIPESPVFPQTPHTLRPHPEAAMPKTRKRDKIFFKSRDTREDRGMCEMNTSHKEQSFQHGR